MSRSLSLAAYRALSRRRFQLADILDVRRPEGDLLWMHAAGPERLQVLCNLAVRIRAQRPGLHVLATATEAPATPPAPPEGCDLFQILDSDHPDHARRFLDHWAPELCLWAGGNLMPNVITQAAGRDMPLVLVDLAAEEVPARRARLMPDLGRLTLASFHRILTRDEAAAAALRRAGVAPERLRVAGRLRTAATPPPCNDDLVEEVTGELGGRPVWFSAGTRPAEIELVLEAHRSATRLLHRLLLVLGVADSRDGVGLRDRVAAAGLRCADWDGGDPIGEGIQVLVTADPGDLGLWYRVAPVTFVAGTFDDRAGGGRHPFEAAALGSAVIHGPNPGRFSEAFARLAAVNAACEVRNAQQLSAELVRLAAPDLAARMALDAWRVATEGAELTDSLIELVQDLLDLREDARAGA